MAFCRLAFAENDLISEEIVCHLGVSERRSREVALVKLGVEVPNLLSTGLVGNLYIQVD